MIIVQCSGCSKRGPDEMIAVNKIGVLVGENDKFTKLRNFFFFFWRVSLKIFENYFPHRFQPRSLELDWVSMHILVVVFIYPKAEVILFLQMKQCLEMDDVSTIHK